EEEHNEFLKPEMTGVSLRVTSDTVDKLDLIAQQLQLSRSDVMRSFLEAGASEALTALNLPVSEVVAFLEATEEKEIDRLIEEEKSNG
ncbi:ribbon-helix-helix protein, CopG family, partial [Sporosarcina sp. FSL K6-5500]|uniref:ribbon-helix-helix protein, CopG family n=1 Tax=Sporosarcina sp. FSL K6-5500 TaxID=2921558 RepID=UPI0030F69431